MGQTVSVNVRVGVLPHPMVKDHYIQSIELFSNDKSIGKLDLNPDSNSSAEAGFQVALAGGMTLKAVAYCNVHGKWESSRGV